ncbi:hypothetical protein AJ79_00169 [Helicocarpus griseus UAMH5409]|uniref:Uncharacterized protein n=1 Tax=Helicocarpus griseus UAMH5409 TaxID=1447875 RepID=A0A2B7YB41_9EURO|nr:hypothetical protein AJ79_00169 [Helicocarpus griseus UAMH5409]
MAGKKTTTRRRGRPSRASTARSDSDREHGHSPTPADLIKDLNSAVEKRSKDKWQKLRTQHRARVKFSEEGLMAMARSFEADILKQQKEDIETLSNLVERRTELEQEIVADIEKLTASYEAAHQQLCDSITRRFIDLRGVPRGL